jgi:DNA-binding NarL/FixJ family response regulator
VVGYAGQVGECLVVEGVVHAQSDDGYGGGHTGESGDPRASAAELVAGLNRMTDRERQVLVLLARGLSNTENATRLRLSEATGRTHIGHLFAKICVRDRAQAVVFAYESGIVHAGDPTA